MQTKLDSKYCTRCESADYTVKIGILNGRDHFKCLKCNHCTCDEWPMIQRMMAGALVGLLAMLAIGILITIYVTR